MKLPTMMIAAAAALAIGCGGSSDEKAKPATVDQAGQAYGILLAHLDFAFELAHENPAALTAADLHEDLNYTSNCTDSGTFAVTGSVDETQSTAGSVSFTYTQNATFNQCRLDGSDLDGALSQTDTFSEQSDGTTTTETYDVELTTSGIAVVLYDANGNATTSFDCGATDLHTTATITVTASSGQAPTSTQSVTGSGTLCGQAWQDTWGSSYQFTAL